MESWVVFFFSWYLAGICLPVPRWLFSVQARSSRRCCLCTTGLALLLTQITTFIVPSDDACPIAYAELMVVSRKLSSSVQPDFPLLSLGITTQHTPNGLMTPRCKSLCGLQNNEYGRGPLPLPPVLENKVVAFGFFPSICTATQPFKKFWSGALAPNDSAVISPRGLLQPTSP